MYSCKYKDEYEYEYYSIEQLHTCQLSTLHAPEAEKTIPPQMQLAKCRSHPSRSFTASAPPRSRESEKDEQEDEQLPPQASTNIGADGSRCPPPRQYCCTSVKSASAARHERLLSTTVAVEQCGAELDPGMRPVAFPGGQAGCSAKGKEKKAVREHRAVKTGKKN